MWIISIGIGKTINGKIIYIVSAKVIKKYLERTPAPRELSRPCKAQPMLDLRSKFR